MASKIQKPCRVCGKMFTPCADCENDKIMFRWKKFSCSLDCAKKYFVKIEESRLAKTGTEFIYDNSMTVSGENGTENPKQKKIRKKTIDEKESEQID